jgi:endonuclease YncB( thermonuclease family)
MSRAVPSRAAQIPRTYAELRRGVEQVIFSGRAKVEEAWVRTYHETGRLIHEHVLRHGARADFGAKVIARLANDAKVSRRTLYECVQFYREFPIVRPVAQLGWNQCRLLCQVGDARERAGLIEQLKHERLRTVDLKARVRSVNAARRLAAAAEHVEIVAAAMPVNAPPLRLLKPKRGTPDRFHLVVRAEGVAVDVGFKLYLPSAAAHAGRIVQWVNGKFAPAPDATTADLFTYRAKVGRVIDGDTLAVTILLPGCEMDEKVRLRGLDCPELGTEAGRNAKHRTEQLVAAATDIVITTSKVDKYDRYLADVHLCQPDGEWLFLNNQLLREGHAVPMGNEAMEEWVP